VKIDCASTLCILASTVLAGLSPQAPQPFSLTIEPVQKTYHPASQVEVKLTLTNTSSFQITVRDTNPWCDYALEVHDSRGQSAPETAYKRGLRCDFQVTAGRNLITILKPGQSYHDALSVNEVYDLSRPGKYFVQVLRQIPKELGGGTIKSNAITIAVEE